ncbi:serine/threonine-protein kinase [Pseudoalteromonas denitrificans]|uniref:Serine/threonine protein kinase n=1 Tax=Pseudoalteromonas denitrificans DSM 6059 TaxID=1123010 RepID=A0A1I1S397_9GAMM|nr:serine/threonine-protein kinase [Pseudoalteromonas denitrificans]SFD40991.1 serine/threonine protein kinase [Pseudoalteromonas denitrificans DSM 6059]
MRNLGHYQLKKLIGQGGMGKVFLAEDTRLHRAVAIKQLKTQTSGSTQKIQIANSLNEARLLAKVNHTNIVQLYDIHQAENQISLVMEYIKGKTLQQFQKQNVTSLIQKLELICQISAGLASAHAEGIIHCDLKASNIIINEKGNAKITDFGIAQLTCNNRESNFKHLTYASSNAASPEQLKNNKIDYRSDLFSLGLLAFTFIAGRHPFDNIKGLNITQAIIDEQPSCASTILPCVPQPLIELLNKLLSKNPSSRPQCSQQVTQRFKQILINITQEEIIAQDTTVLSELTAPKITQSKFKKNQNILTIVGVLSLVVACILAYFFKIEPVHRYVVVLKPKLNENSQLSEMHKDLVTVTIDDAIRQLIINNPRIQLISREEVLETKEGLKKVAQITGASDIISTNLNCNNIQCSVISSHLSGKHWSVTAQKNWNVNIKNYREIYHNATTQMASLLNIKEDNNQGNVSINENDYIAYIKLYNNIELKGEDSDNNLSELKTLLNKAPQLFSGYSLYRKTSLEMYYQTKESYYLNQLSELLNNAPITYRNSMLFTIDSTMLAIAEGKLEQADEILKQSRKYDVDPVIYHELRAEWYLAKNDLLMAIKQTKLALSFRSNSILQYNLAALYFQNSEIEQAKTLLLNLLNLTPDNYRPNQLLADIYLAEGNIDEAITAYNKTININAQPLDLNNLGLSYLLKKQYPKALVSARKAWSKSPKNSMMLLNLADIEWLAGNTTQAKKYYQQILTMLAGQNTFYALLDSAQAYAHLKEYNNALKSLNQAIKISPNRLEYSYAAALIYTLAGENKSALVHVEEAVKSGYGAVWFNLAWFSELCDYQEFNMLLQSLGSRNSCLNTQNEN